MLSRVIPALFTTMSSLPSSLTAFSTAALTLASSETSQVMPMALPPLSVRASALEATASAFMSSSATAAPSETSRSAIPKPIPCAAPLMIATRPSNRAIACLILRVVAAASLPPEARA